MNQKAKRQSNFPDANRTAKSRSDIAVFNHEDAMAKCEQEAVELARQLVEDNEQLDRDKAYRQQSIEENHNQLVQAWQDKKRIRSSEKEQRKLLAELKERTKRAQQETQQVQAEREEFQRRIQQLDRNLQLQPPLPLAETIEDRKRRLAVKLRDLQEQHNENFDQTLDETMQIG